MSTVQRAYELAASGECADLKEVKARLSAEKHVNVTGHLHGRSITADLARLCREAAGMSPRCPPTRPPAGTPAVND